MFDATDDFVHIWNWNYCKHITELGQQKTSKN